MKKFLVVLLACCMVLGGCGEKEESGIKKEEHVKQETEAARETDSINGFERAVYGKFNSPAEENGLGGTLIYVDGEATTKVEAENVLAFTLQQADGNSWVISLSDRPNEDGDIIDGIIRKEVRVFGEYIGYSDAYKMPGIMLMTGGGKIYEGKPAEGLTEVWNAEDYYNERFGESEQGETETPEPQETEPQNDISPEPDDNLTMGQQNALRSALQYLDYSSFSHDGLVEQLEYEGYTSEEAVYAADNCGADWNEQAAKSAKQYLSYSAFSREGLIDQLQYEGFTAEQATYGAEANGY